MIFARSFRPLVIAVATMTVACHARSASSASSASTAPSPARAAKPAMPPGVTAAMIASGDSIFNNRSCKNCHLVGGVGGPRGPNLTDSQWIHIDGSYDAIVNLVTTGFTKAEQVDKDYQFSMNPRGGVNLSDADIRAVAAYVYSLSHK
jgi:cytochrome c5